MSYMIIYVVDRYEDRNIDNKHIFSSELVDLCEDRYDLLNIYKPALLIYFSTSCQFCMDEINSISQNIGELQKVKIVLVSSEPLENIVQFAANFDTTNLTFLQDRQGELKKILRVKNYPSIFVFSKEKDLIKQYKGSVPINKIIAEIPNE